MARGHRSQIKRERNANKDTRPSAKLSYARVSVTKACTGCHQRKGYRHRAGNRDIQSQIRFQPREEAAGVRSSERGEQQRFEERESLCG